MFHQIGKIFHGYFQIYCSYSKFELGTCFSLSGISVSLAEDNFLCFKSSNMMIDRFRMCPNHP